MFHNYYKIYQTGPDTYNIEIYYWHEYENITKQIHLDLDKNQLDKLQNMLDGVSFEDETDEEF